MIKIKIEMHPYGIEELKKEIGKIDIWNDRSGNLEFGNYKVKFGDSKKNIEISNHERKKSVYSLLKKVMEQYNE